MKNKFAVRFLRKIVRMCPRSSVPSEMNEFADHQPRKFALRSITRKFAMMNPQLAKTLNVSAEASASRIIAKQGCRVVRQGWIQVCGEKHGINLTHYLSLQPPSQDVRQRARTIPQENKVHKLGL